MCRCPHEPDVGQRHLALDGIAAGAPEVVADDTSRQVRAALSGPLSNLYPSVV